MNWRRGEDALLKAVEEDKGEESEVKSREKENIEHSTFNVQHRREEGEDGRRPVGGRRDEDAPVER